MARNKNAATAERTPAAPFDAAVLEQLLALEDSAQADVLSLYLDIEPGLMPGRGFETALKDLLKPLKEQFADGELAPVLEEEIRRVQSHVEAWPQAPGRSFAIFSSAQRDVFAPIALEVPLRSGAWFGVRPHLMPLIALLDEHERYCVALVEKGRGRVITVWLGQIERAVEIANTVPGRTQAGGWRQAQNARHRDDAVQEHLQQVIEELWRTSRRAPFDRLLIGGPDDAMSALRRLLPRSLADKVAGEFAVQTALSDGEIVERVSGVQEEAERAQEFALVRDVLERAPAADLATVGWTDTLGALNEGRVHILVLVDEAGAPGFVCPNDDYASAEGATRCPLCESVLQPVDDIADWTVRKAIETSARVELVRGDAAAALGEHAVGALLRY